MRTIKDTHMNTCTDACTHAHTRMHACAHILSKTTCLVHNQSMVSIIAYSIPTGLSTCTTHSSTCPLLQVIEPLSPLNHLGQVVPHHSLHLHKEGDRSSAWASIRMGNGQYPNRYGQTPKGWGAIGIQGNMQVSIVYCQL